MKLIESELIKEAIVADLKEGFPEEEVDVVSICITEEGVIEARYYFRSIYDAEDKWERATYGIGLVEENEKTPKYFSEGG